MLRNALFSLLILLMGKCYAQESFFVLIQADNSQPFYVKMDDKSLSSTAKGRLILSQMKSGSQTITIGFPKQLFPEQQYTFNIDQDLEFQLKDLGERGWGLFNPQTQELKTADKASSTSVRSEGIKKDDAFSRLMAGVVGDTAVMYNTYAMEEALKDSPVAKSAPSRDPARSVVRTDSNVAVGGQTAAAQVDTTTASTPLPVTRSPATPTTAAVTPASVTRSPVTSSATARTAGKGRPPLSTTAYAAGAIDKLSERKTPRGLRIAFADRPVGKKADTVIIIIPLDTAATRDIASSDPSQAPTAEPLFRPKPDPTEKSDPTGISGSTGVPDSAGKHDLVGKHSLPGKNAPSRKHDSSEKHDLSEKQVLSEKQDLSEKRDAVGKPGFTGSAGPDSVVIASSEKVVRDNPDTIHVYVSAAKKAPRTKPDSSHTPSGQGAADQNVAQNKPDISPHPPVASPSRELYRKPDSPSQKSTKLVVMNSDCRNFASDYDVDKLRVKMLDADKDDDKIQTARKIFKTKCFTTKQIRALSEVFTSDAGKYRFFETAYPFVSDDHFRELTDLLADPVYNGKFRAMTGQQ
ncbi:MAG TPA: DUF4476 domain-containing protein [Puia sp.]|nr:DUF4476 domain-containing protein [Puia sp.]